MADLVGVLALGGAPGREVGLERHLDDDRAAGAGDLGEQRRRVGDVLEHVGEDPEVVGAVGGGQVQAVVELDGVDLLARAGDLDGRLGDLHAREAPAEVAAVQLGEQRAVAAADLERIDWMPARPQARARAEREHVVGLPDRAERAPARVAGGVGGGLGVALVVEPDQLLGVLHRAIIRPQDTSRTSPVWTS